MKTRIIFVLDRSGSMNSIVDETIGGYNAFIQGQREIPGEATVTLIQFDNLYGVDYFNRDIKDVPDLDRETYVPRGMTALYDAIGRTISSHLPSQDEEKVYDKTILAILTDGAENSSKEYSHQTVNSMITHVQDELDWEVLFIGANIDVKEYSNLLGIKAGNAVAFDYTAKGAVDAMTTLNLAASATRGFQTFYADGTAVNSAELDMDKLYATVKNQ